MDLQPRKQPRQDRAKATVDAILDAAAHILAAQGREAATTNAVAARAGVSIGSLYQYFPNRDAVLGAVVHRHGHRIHRLVAECLSDPPPATLADAVNRIVAAVFEAHRLDPHLHGALDHDFNAAHDHGHGHPSTKTAVRQLFATLPPPVATEIGVRSPDAALVVTETIHSLAHAAHVHPGPGADPPALRAQAAAVALAYLRHG